MRSLAVLTTTAAIALFGAANAQNNDSPVSNAPPTAPAGPAATAPANPLQESVQRYAAFQADIGTLRGANINNDAALERALDTSSRHNRDQLSRGWIAYGAMTAAQSPEFMQGVRNAAAYYGRDAVVRGMLVDTSWARTLTGGEAATRIVLSSASADSQRIITVADRYQELAYGLQRQRWANAVAPRQADRVNRMRSNGVAPAAVAADLSRLYVRPTTYSPMTDPSAYGGRLFWDAVGGTAAPAETVSAPNNFQWRLKPDRGEAVHRMLTIAGLQALDAAEERPQEVDRLLNEQRSRDCVEMSQLQLYQCMSAARFRYENAFCLGQHALRDIGNCIGAVGQPVPTEGASAIPSAGAQPRAGSAEAALASINR